jgi:DNA mismatch endonuclease (patch repair protein)
MADIVDKYTRSRMMSGIRGTNTEPEIRIRCLLHRRGFRFRLHVKDLPGKPDIVLPRYHAVVFVHGCFWHGHDCHLFKMPSTRPEFWQTKICRNRENDRRAIETLFAAGWRIAIIWECAMKGRQRLSDDILIEHLALWLRNKSDKLELPTKGGKA